METDQHRDQAGFAHGECREEQQPRARLAKQASKPNDEGISLRLVRRQRDHAEDGAECLEHPDVLHMRWQIHRKSAQWQNCFRIAQVFAQTAPNDPRAWTSLAQTFYYSKRVQEAYDLAVSKITTFPSYWPLYYDAACYACLTGRLPQARQFLQVATILGDEAEVKLLASQDPDLESLRKSES